MDLSNRVALIPCFNVHLFCEKPLRETLPFVEHLILIDDGSTDGTNIILKKLALEFPKIHLIEFPENRGKGFALIEGFRYAIKHLTFHALITLDSDGQHDPRDIPSMASEIENGADMVIGTREFHKMPYKSRIANKLILHFLRSIYKKAPYDTQSGLRAFNEELVYDFSTKIDGGRYETEFSCLLLAMQEKKKIITHPISTVYFENNKHSHFSVFKDSFRILKVLWRHIRQRN